ncbi:hypothetical protein [Kangiella sp. TOML190]|uniref:hypothetical protein n=1 Tax=Kangiella sp. TOML190 TaxID=2931351 RepID=UPI00203E4716|nr:hypothetical protein [Kangiella sp. TOML190]
MSGSGSGSPGNFGGFGKATVDCSQFSFETHISSPDGNVINTLEAGMILTVTLEVENGIEAVQVSHEGRRVGGLVQNADKLKQCLALEYRFTAVIREISGALISIFVQSQGR